MYSIMHTDGSGEYGPDDLPSRETTLSTLYDELATADEEHGDVAVVHVESLWNISAHRSGQVIMGRTRDPFYMHLVGLSKERVLDLWRRLVDGDIASLQAEPWKPGHAR